MGGGEGADKGTEKNEVIILIEEGSTVYIKSVLKYHCWKIKY